MQQPPMGGPPMGAMPMPRPKKRGVSKAVPVVVSAGLAVGVFCGLLFGLGTGEPAAAGPSKGNNLGSIKEDPTPPPETAPVNTPPPPKPATGSAGSAAVATATGSAGSAATGSAGSAATGSAGSAATVASKENIPVIIVEVLPASAASSAKIQIDGKDITGTKLELAPDTKSVKITVKSDGYRSVENKKVDVTAGADTKVSIELQKKSSGGSPGFGGASTGGNHVPTAPPRPKKPNNPGVIDI
ncbi:MAG: PEGA domain-containing protein [Kofleriaceae bacterium]